MAAAAATAGDLDIQTPRVYLPLLAPARYKGAHGGRGSAKSWFFAEMLIETLVMNPKTRAVCVREIQKSLDQSAKKLLEDTIQRFGVGYLLHAKNTHIETDEGGIILFQGMQNHTAESIKSLEGINIAWCEEAQSLSQRSLDLLRPTIREEESELWFSWNPRKPTDPIDVLLRGDTPPSNAVVVQSTYRDNPFFPSVLREEMEYDKRRDPEKYAHVWLGEYERRSEARVFKNWRVDDFETPADAVFLQGGDWGFSTDPTVLVRAYVVGKTIFIDYECYKIGVEIDYTPAFFDTLANEKSPTWPINQKPGPARDWPIVADSARPETISYLQRHNYPKIEAAKKGPDSVKEGIIFLQSYDIVVHRRCVHTIDELTMYSYVVDKMSGIVTPYLADKKNHVIDSLRYAVERLRKPEDMPLTW